MQRLGICGCLALAALFVHRRAEASCGPVHCALTPVDASCEPLAGAVQGDAVRVQLDCSVTCCSGAANCGQSPYVIDAEALELWRYVEQNGVLTPDKSHAVGFRAHPTCNNVYEAQSCVESGKHVFSEGGMELEVAGDACAEDSGGCHTSRAPRGLSGLGLAAIVLGVSAARRRRR